MYFHLTTYIFLTNDRDKNIQISEQIIFKSGSHQELDFEDDSAELIQSSFLSS